ncbi:uncharacterized protein Tco025E_00300 [Trypanosoma conorhini]|uniref:Atg6 BARA domain-containing protein n=1 Tax=Trypanosoma conorhini TaxID=83891 RepID=A0A3R7LFL2_9TRYP|nr:uncharacterized protein Tco025E_00300 [Trypanosoma conorhini]RNF27438.1 hypothetical protein Tco025E_00300 [Trypanosoma conorhini]
MRGAGGEGGNVVGTLAAAGDNAAYAPVCALFTCCVCRRTVQLDGQNVACHTRLPAKTAIRLLSPLSTSPSHVGGFLMSSRASCCLDDEAGERRRLRDRHMRVLHELEEACLGQEGRAQQTCLQEPRDLESERELHETRRRQKLHPAIKGSLLSAAGKYAPLAPSPLSPWLHERCALLKEDPRVVRGSKPPAISSHTKRTPIAQARMVTRLAPLFVYQYEWLANGEPAVYMRELWRMLHDGPVPPPQPSSQLTVQRAEFSLEEPAVPLSPPSGTHQCEPTRSASPSSLSPACADSSSSVVAHAQPLSVPFEDTAALHSHLPFSAGNVRPHTGLITAQSTPHSPRVLNLRKITYMAPYAAGLPGAAHTTAAQHAGTASDSSSMTTATSLPLKSCPASLSREDFLSSFSRNLLCLVVHKSRTDVPLCTSCWKDSLETQRKETTRIMEDVVALSAVSASPDANSVILCFCPRRQRDAEGVVAHNSFTQQVGLIEHGEKPLGRRQPSAGDDVLLCVSAAECGVVSQESLHRLQVEVWEADEKSRLVAKACQALQDELTALSRQRVARRAEWEMAAAKHDAQQVVSFFAAEDAAAGVSLRTRHAACSYLWMSKMHAMSLAFPVDTSGLVATIAGLRLGKCPAAASSRRHSSTGQQRQFVSLPQSGPGSAAESNKSVESTVLMNLLHMQQEYARSFLGSRNDSVSAAEINQACGYLLLLLEYIKVHHRIPLEKYALRPNGEQSTVEVVSSRGSPPQMTRRSSDFYICEKLFAWKTFGAACVIVAAFVQELVAWMERRLLELRDDVHRRLREEEEAAAQSTWVSSAAAVLESLGPAEAPYAIVQDKVDGFPVRHGDVAEELWTLGMKKLLEVVQWCVAASGSVDALERVLQEA